MDFFHISKYFFDFCPLSESIIPLEKTPHFYNTFSDFPGAEGSDMGRNSPKPPQSTPAGKFPQTANSLWNPRKWEEMVKNQFSIEVL